MTTAQRRFPSSIVSAIQLIISATVAGSAFIAVPLIAKEKLPDRVIVPGGITAARLAMLWKTAKLKCVEYGFTVANEDREIGTIFCTKPTEMGASVIRVTFDNEGFIVVASGVASGVPLLGNYLKKRKRDLIAALTEAIG